MSHLQSRLRQIRRARNLSQEELAKQLGISRQALIALEQGDSLPSLPVVLAMLHTLDIPFHQLFGANWTPFRSNNPQNDSSQDTLLSSYRHTSEAIPLVLSENSNFIYITAELPGVKEEDITIDLGSQHCVIMAVKRPPHKEDVQFCNQEIHYGPLVRIIGLPAPINTEETSARFIDGVLHLAIPKSFPNTKRRITFKKNEET